MGAIVGLIGGGGGANGTGYQAPTSANIQAGATTDQATTAYNQSQQSIGSQQALLAALQGQNGLGNQSSVFGQQQGLANQLGQANGLGTQQSAVQGLRGVAGMQQGTMGQYQNLASGVGPNPAQAQLNQNTAANVAQTGALMAGQRGAAQNVGLLARQAGMQGAQTQQGAVGQAASLQAQQQLAGLSGLSAQQAALGQTQGMIAGVGQQQLAAQQAQQGALAGTANTQASNQIGQTNAITGANQAQYGNVLNALGALNNTNVGMQSNVNNVSGQLANTTMQGQQALIGGLLSPLGGASKAAGGYVERFDEGGDVDNSAAPDSATPTFGSDAGAAALGRGPLSGITSMFSMLMADGGMPAIEGQPAYAGQSAFGQFLAGVQNAGGAPGGGTPGFGSSSGAAALQKGVGDAAKNLTRPKPKNITDSTTDSAPIAGDQGEASADAYYGTLAARGGEMGKKDYRGGGKVDARGAKQKAVAPGDNYSNDKIPAVLSEHEIVLPRSVTMSNDPAGNAARFVQATLARRRGKR